MIVEHLVDGFHQILAPLISERANLVIREYTNAAFFGALMCLSWRFFKVWMTTDAAMRPILHAGSRALTFMFLGEGLRSLLAWVSLSARISKWPEWIVFYASPLWLVSGAIFLAGVALTIFAFPTPPPPGVDPRHHEMTGLIKVGVVVLLCVIVSAVT